MGKRREAKAKPVGRRPNGRQAIGRRNYVIESTAKLVRKLNNYLSASAQHTCAEVAALVGVREFYVRRFRSGGWLTDLMERRLKERLGGFFSMVSVREELRSWCSSMHVPEDCVPELALVPLSDLHHLKDLNLMAAAVERSEASAPYGCASPGASSTSLVLSNPFFTVILPRLQRLMLGGQAALTAAVRKLVEAVRTTLTLPPLQAQTPQNKLQLAVAKQARRVLSTVGSFVELPESSAFHVAFEAALSSGRLPPSQHLRVHILTSLAVWKRIAAAPGASKSSAAARMRSSSLVAALGVGRSTSTCYSFASPFPRGSPTAAGGASASSAGFAAGGSRSILSAVRGRQEEQRRLARMPEEDRASAAQLQLQQRLRFFDFAAQFPNALPYQTRVKVFDPVDKVVREATVRYARLLNASRGASKRVREDYDYLVHLNGLKTYEAEVWYSGSQLQVVAPQEPRPMLHGDDNYFGWEEVAPYASRLKYLGCPWAYRVSGRAARLASRLPLPPSSALLACPDLHACALCLKLFRTGSEVNQHERENCPLSTSLPGTERYRAPAPPAGWAKLSGFGQRAAAAAAATGAEVPESFLSIRVIDVANGPPRDRTFAGNVMTLACGLIPAKRHE
eukprot:GHVT01073852.1.p1 GENE.GHVT01073852.1~~GHVT01073852.1.p1  ORF type:complete len:623 (+),score=147.90 GHVT01073852.1:1039-2907(+)